MRSLPELLLEDWNVYQAQTFFFSERVKEGLFLPTRKDTKQNIALLEQVVAWCRERNAEPRLWLYFLFRVRNWKFPPKFTAGCLMSEPMLVKFRKVTRGLGFFRHRMASSASENGGAEEMFDPNRDTAPAVEAVKQRFQEANNPNGCMQQMIATTLGFHPKSVTCSRCLIRADCAALLEASVPFPILALRAHRITPAEAQRIAEAKVPA